MRSRKKVAAIRMELYNNADKLVSPGICTCLIGQNRRSSETGSESIATQAMARVAAGTQPAQLCSSRLTEALISVRAVFLGFGSVASGRLRYHLKGWFPVRRS